MHPNTRALVAVAAERLTSGGPVGPVYDYSRLRYVQCSGFVSDGRVAIYDQERRCQFVGGNGSFHDHGRGALVLLRVSGRTFSGHDHGDGHRFSGSVEGGAVLIYDFGESSYFSYRVTPPPTVRDPHATEQGAEASDAPVEPEEPARDA